MATIDVQLTPDRTVGGFLILRDGTGAQVGNGLSVLGKAAVNTATANGNPVCDPTLKFGDTPTGDYTLLKMTEYVAPYNVSKKYGPNGVIQMDPSSGDAATAQANGRTGILIHGGDLGAGGQLRRTNGCLRLRNDEYVYLKGLINGLLPTDPVTTISVSELGTPSHLPCDNNADCDEDDPPPGF